MTVKVLRPGALATLQDLGRGGMQHLGIVPGGAMDAVSHRIANALVGNRADAATLEIAISGPELLFERRALVALAGARFEAGSTARRCPDARPVLVHAGARLRIGRATAGCVRLSGGRGRLRSPVGARQPQHLSAGCVRRLTERLLSSGASLPLARTREAIAAERFARALRKRQEVELAGGAARSVRWLAPALTVPGTTIRSLARVVDGVHAALFDGRGANRVLRRALARRARFQPDGVPASRAEARVGRTDRDPVAGHVPRDRAGPGRRASRSC